MNSPSPDNHKQPVVEAPGHELPSVAKDNKNYITPYAFAVSAELYGKPLAGPGRRGLAMLIDAALVLLLTHLSDFMLFGFIGWTLLGAGRQLASKPGYRFSRNALKVIGGFCMFIFVVGCWEYIDDKHFTKGPEYEVTHVPGDEVNPAEISETTLPAEPEETDLSSAESRDLWQQIEDELASMGINFGWAAFYFSVFTGWFSGQTIGKKICGIKVIKLDGSDLNLWEAFGRYGGYTAGFATGLMGFIQVYWDPNRQAIQDKISGTLVVVKDAPKVCIETKLP
ncbi:RDD family protein [Planctobacterium marinum]|uniref:RDD family protein n=1 Tax=Planctobacterium marinum TaxID=1631968 RepID=UPI001E580D5F|nr:RDD family protein [Planctobacterium marinum]MCC2604447.1 RDD family protein [Planctobacterium marinum]